MREASRRRSWVHYGATSQDVLDTALVLLMRNALVEIQKTMDALDRALTK